MNFAPIEVNLSDLKSIASTKRGLPKSLLAATEQRKLEEGQSWFSLSNFQVWGMKVHKIRVAESNGDVHFTLRM